MSHLASPFPFLALASLLACGPRVIDEQEDGDGTLDLTYEDTTRRIHHQDFGAVVPPRVTLATGCRWEVRNTDGATLQCTDTPASWFEFPIVLEFGPGS